MSYAAAHARTNMSWKKTESPQNSDIGKGLAELKDLEDNGKKKLEYSEQEEMGQLHIRKASSCVAIIFICTATSVACMVGPLYVYTSGAQTSSATPCSLQQYKGTVCQDVFMNRTLCIDTGNIYTYGSTFVLQYLREVTAAQQLQSMLKNGTRCAIAMMPYICLNTFGVTSQETNNVSHLKDLEMCLNSTAVDPSEHLSGFANTTACSTFFYYDEASGLCKPTCSVFTDRNKSAENGLFIFGIFGCILAFIASGFNHKVMRKFPSVLLIYWLVSGGVYCIAMIVDCCTTSDYFENYNSPGPLCQLKGFLLMFLAYVMVVFPLAHTTTLFWIVWFPHSYKNFFSSTQRKLRLHAFVLLLAFVVPGAACAGVLVIWEIGDGGQFYYLSTVITTVPLYGMFGVVAALVALSVWKLMKVNVKSAEHSCCSQCCTPELKLAAVFIYIIILFGTTIARHVLEMHRTYGYVDDYFLCESLGTANACHLDPDRINAAIDAFVNFHTLVFSLSPYASLIFILPAHLIKKKMRKWRSKPAEVTLGTSKSSQTCSMQNP